MTRAYRDELLQRRVLTATSTYSDVAITATNAYSDERLQQREGNY